MNCDRLLALLKRAARNIFSFEAVFVLFLTPGPVWVALTARALTGGTINGLMGWSSLLASMEGMGQKDAAVRIVAVNALPCFNVWMVSLTSTSSDLSRSSQNLC